MEVATRHENKLNTATSSAIQLDERFNCNRSEINIYTNNDEQNCCGWVYSDKTRKYKKVEKYFMAIHPQPSDLWRCLRFRLRSTWPETRPKLWAGSEKFAKVRKPLEKLETFNCGKGNIKSQKMLQILRKNCFGFCCEKFVCKKTFFCYWVITKSS